MPDELCKVIKDKLRDMGYRNVESNCGTIWYSDGTTTWAIGETRCEEEV